MVLSTGETRQGRARVVIHAEALEGLWRIDPTRTGVWRNDWRMALPYANTDMMQLHLDEISRNVAEGAPRAHC
jgi:hypothetical protein